MKTMRPENVYQIENHVRMVMSRLMTARIVKDQVIIGVREIRF